MYHDLLRNFRRHFGPSIISHITVDNLYEGLNGVKTIVRETSEIDPNHGVIMLNFLSLSFLLCIFYHDFFSIIHIVYFEEMISKNTGRFIFCNSYVISFFLYFFRNLYSIPQSLLKYQVKLHCENYYIVKILCIRRNYKRESPETCGLFKYSSLAYNIM